MKKIIFLSSPDMTGKTQIAKKLSEIYNLPYYKASTEHSAFIKNQSRFINDIQWSCPARLDLLNQQIEQGFINGIVYDRGYPCEWVYSRFFNRKTDDESIFWLDEQYAKLGSYIIIPYRTSYEGIQDDLDPTITSEKLKKLDDLYVEFMKLTKCKTLRLCVDDEDLNREIKDIKNFIDMGKK
jgi:hypothetical protein